MFADSVSVNLFFIQDFGLNLALNDLG